VCGFDIVFFHGKDIHVYDMTRVLYSLEGRLMYCSDMGFVRFLRKQHMQMCGVNSRANIIIGTHLLTLYDVIQVYVLTITNAE
jgi:hypothetical protein